MSWFSETKHAEQYKTEQDAALALRVCCLDKQN